MIFAHLVSLMIRRWLKRRWLARMVYAVTDHRAIVARIEGDFGELQSCSLRPGEIIDTRQFENPDGSGDLYFIGHGFDHWLPIGFLEVRQVGLVEALVRDALAECRGRLVEVRIGRSLLSKDGFQQRCFIPLLCEAT